MRQNESVAPMLGDGGYPDIIDVRATRTRPVAPNVSVATNTPTDWKTAVVAGLFVAGTSAVLGVALWYYSSMPGWLVFAVTFSLLLYSGYRVIIIVNGDHVASLEVRKNEKIAMKNIESIDKEVSANREVILAKIDAQDKHLERQHELEMTKLTHDKTLLSLQEDVAHLLAESSSAPSHNYVNNKREPMLIDIELWLRELYATPGSINDSGTVAVKLPWNERWTSKPWRDEAQKILTRGDFSPIVPVINEKTGKPSHHYVRYEELNDAIKQVKRG